MASRHDSTATTYHTCTCGDAFETTEALLEHAREVHGFDGY